MTISQLRAFIESYVLRSFTAAAKSLGVSQASISESVSRLESELDVTLFIRDMRGLVPTAEAERLIPYAEEIVRKTLEAEMAVSAAKKLLVGSAQFGVPRNARFYGLQDFAVEFYSDFPEVRLRLNGVNSSLVSRDVAKGILEAGLVVLPVDVEGLNVEPIAKDEVLLAVPDGYEEKKARISIFRKYPLVAYDAHVGWNDPTRRQIFELCQEEGIVLEPAIEVEQVEVALELVRRGAGMCLVSDSLARAGAVPAGVKLLHFEERLEETLAIVSRQGRVLSPAAVEIVRRVKHSVWKSFESN